MFSKKLTDKSLMASLILLGILILVLVYFVPTRNVLSEITDYEAKNSKLEATLASLQVYYDNRATYIQNTAELQNEIVNLVSSYPAGYRPEDYIMQAVSVEKVTDDITYESIQLRKIDTIASVDQKTVAGANIENLKSQIEFNHQDVVYTNTIDYLSLKQALAELFRSPYCINIQSITYKTNKTDGMLKGDIVVGYYYVTGTGVEYNPPAIPDYEMGTDNIFGHYEVIDEADELGESTMN